MGQAKQKRNRQKQEEQKLVEKSGVFSEYLKRQMSPQEREKERKAQLARISQLRKRSVLVMAADYRKANNALISISYDDILPFKDLMEALEGDAVDVILETPGGSAEVVEDLVRLLRDRFESVAFIIPGWAKSAGTIMAMGGDEILMGPASALGPIDAQIQWKGKTFSAEAFLEGLRQMKEEAADPKKGLNHAHIPILQQISPGEIQHARNALDFAQVLVADWLEQYKFRTWTNHRNSAKPVSDTERRQTARKIAAELCKHQKWLSHGRSIKIDDLRKLGLEVIDYSETPELYDAIRRYHALLQMTFESNIYKLFENPHGIVVRMLNIQPQMPPEIQQQIQQQVANAKSVNADVPCPLCKQSLPLQLKFEKGVADNPGRIPYPKGDTLACPNCRQNINLSGARELFERQFNRKVIPS